MDYQPVRYSGNHQPFNDKLNAYLGARPSRGGLPKNVMIQAYQGYGESRREWHELIRHGAAFNEYLASQMPDVEVELVQHRSASVRQDAVGVVAYHTNAAPIDEANSTGSLEPLFGAAIDAFVFWRWGVWWLQCWDPVVMTGHVHRRVLSRSTAQPSTFAEFHGTLSVLWPSLIELGNRRRRLGERANVTSFCFPLWDGLVFGELQKADQSSPFAPILRELKNGEIREKVLGDRFSNGSERLLVQVRTFYSEKRFNLRQKTLRSNLRAFIAKHSDALEYLQRRYRLGVSFEGVIGKQLGRVFERSVVGQSGIDQAISELDLLTKSDAWLQETARSQATHS